MNSELELTSNLMCKVDCKSSQKKKLRHTRLRKWCPCASIICRTNCNALLLEKNNLLDTIAGGRKKSWKECHVCTS